MGNEYLDDLERPEAKATHKDSEIEWATTPPGDPNANFVVRSEDYLGGDRAFVQALKAELARRPAGPRP